MLTTTKKYFFYKSYLLGLEADGESTEVYFESVTFPSLLYKNIGFEVEISHT